MKILPSLAFDKKNKYTYLGNEYVVKCNQSGLRNFVERGQALHEEFEKSYATLMVPGHLTSLNDNIKYYHKVPGSTLTDSALEDNSLFDLFLNQCHVFLSAKMKPNADVVMGSFKNRVLNRAFSFLEEYPEFDSEIAWVNSIRIPNTPIQIKNIVEVVAKKFRSEGNYLSLCHGDLTLDNIIYGNDKNFYVIDWRPEFRSESGSISYTTSPYYDLGKLYAFLYYDFRALKDGEHQLEYELGEMRINKKHSRFEKLLTEYESWILANGYDLRLVQFSSALHLIAMSGLHSRYHASFCFFQGLHDLTRYLGMQRR